MNVSMASAINWLPRGLSIVNYDKRPDQMVNKVNMVRAAPKTKPIALVKPMAMVRPLKRDNPENLSKDSSCKKLKVSEDLYKLDELSECAKEVNKPAEVEKFDPKTSARVMAKDGHESVKRKSKLLNYMFKWSFTIGQREELGKAFAENENINGQEPAKALFKKF